MELNFQNQLYAWRGALDVSDSPIVIVAISQEADEEIPQKYPWPTDLHARLIRNLNKAGALAIGFDVIFDQPDIYSPANDSTFAEHLATFKNVVLSAGIGNKQLSAGELSSPLIINPLLREANPNRPALAEIFKEIDGSVRRYTFGRDVPEGRFYMLAQEVLRVSKNLPLEAYDFTKTPPVLGSYAFKQNTANSFLINYHGAAGTFPVYSFETIIDDSTYTTVFERDAFELNEFDDPETGLLQQEVFKNKIVLVGATMPTLQDFHLTPTTGIRPFRTDSAGALRENIFRKGITAGDGMMPGVEIHAHALQTILSGNYLQKTGTTSWLLTLFSLCIVLGFINFRFKTYVGTVVFLALGCTYVYLGFLLFTHQQLLLIFTAPIFSLGFTQVGSIYVEYQISRSERQRIESMFSSYVSPNVVKQLIESGTVPALGGEEITGTAFFSDIAGFSEISEQLEPRKLVGLMNEYLSEMSLVLTGQNGTVDKYIGDAIVGIFGAPLPLENHAWHACKTALEMQTKQKELNSAWKEAGFPHAVVQMQTRIGLNTGNMITGNMGSSLRFNYTMMGDNVNVAARCESAAKLYGIYTMLTEATRDAANADRPYFLFRELDTAILRGKSTPVRLFELIGEKTDSAKSTRELIAAYEEALALYYLGNWSQAEEAFRESSKLESGSKNPSSIMMKRCQTIAANPPENWQGFINLE